MNQKQKRKNKYLPWIFMIMAAAIVAILFVCFMTDKNKPTFIVSGHPEWPLAMYQDKEEIAGIGAELMKMIGKDLGFNVEAKYTGQWGQTQKKAENGELDAIVGIYRTAERENYLDFSAPYLLDPVAVYVKKGKSFNAPDWDSYIGKKGVLTTGDSYGQALDTEMEQIFTTVRVDTVAQAFDMLINDEADYFIYAYNAGDKALKEAGLPDQIEILPRFIVVEYLHFAFPKNSPMIGYLPQINEKLEQYKKDGTMDRLTAKYRSKFYSE